MFISMCATGLVGGRRAVRVERLRREAGRRVRAFVLLVWAMSLLCRDGIGFHEQTFLNMGGGNGPSSYRRDYLWRQISLDNERDLTRTY